MQPERGEESEKVDMFIAQKPHHFIVSWRKKALRIDSMALQHQHREYGMK